MEPLLPDARRLLCSGMVNWKRFVAACIELFDNTRSSNGLPATLFADLGVWGVFGVCGALGDCGRDSGESGRMASTLGTSFFFDFPNPTLLAKMEVRDFGFGAGGAICCGSAFFGGGWSSILLIETSLALRSESRRATEPANECLKLRMLESACGR